MNKKKVVTVIIAIVVLLGIAGWVLVPKIELHMQVKKFFFMCETCEFCESGHFITDFTSREEDTFAFSNEYYTVEIPEGYTQKYYENINTYVFESDESEKAYVIFNYTSDMTKTMMDPVYESVYGISPYELRTEFEEFSDVVPDSHYNIFKAAVLLDEEDYKFWDHDRQIAVMLLGDVKAKLHENGQIWLYERDDIRAVILKEGGKRRYSIDVMKSDDLNTAYGMYMRGAEKEDVWKLLNSFEFN